MFCIKHRIVRFISVFVIFGISSLLVNNILFLHAHTLPNGEKIYHTHPYSKTAEGSEHSHTKEELTMINSLSQQNVVLTDIIRICERTSLTVDYVNPFPSYISYVDFSLPNFRAPPIV